MTYASSSGGPGVVFSIQQGMVDRGADIGWLSQYPHEKEILFAPLGSLEIQRLDVEGTVLVPEIRASAQISTHLPPLHTSPTSPHISHISLHLPYLPFRTHTRDQCIGSRLDPPTSARPILAALLLGFPCVLSPRGRPIIARALQGSRSTSTRRRSSRSSAADGSCSRTWATTWPSRWARPSLGPASRSRL